MKKVFICVTIGLIFTLAWIRDPLYPIPPKTLGEFYINAGIGSGELVGTARLFEK